MVVDQRGTIVFTKAVSPEGAGDQVFGFVSPCGGHAIVEGQTGECTVPAGTYDVVEEDPAPNFALGSIECDDDDSSGDVATRTATYVLGPGEVVNCTFTNVDQRGTIVFTKAVSPEGAGDQVFGFVSPCGGHAIVEGQTGECTVPAGTYDVVEEDPAPNFALGSIECDDDDSSGDVATRTATYVLGPGEVVNCTFTNVDQRGTIVFTKAVSPEGAGDQVFGFVSPCGGHAIVEGQTGECTVPAGTYDVVEEDPAPNFALGSIECDDDDSSGDVATRTATYVLGPGEVVNCTFTNVDQRGTIVFTKAVSPEGAGDQVFGFVSPCGGHAIVEGQTGECTVPAGTYDVVEEDPAPNFALGSIECDDDDSSGDVATRTATYVLGPGEVVNCTFTNVDQRGTIVFTKAVSPEGAGDQVFGFVSPCGGHAIVEGQTGECTVPAGTYDVVEEDPAPNFALGSIECDDDDSSGDVATRTATYVLGPGEVVNCTFTNVDQRGTIVFTKAVSPEGAGDQVFGFVSPCGGHAIVEGQTGECTVPAGTYDVVEEDPAPNFALGSIECDDDDSSGDVATRTATYVLGPGEVVNCTFTNVDQRGTTAIEVTKNALPNTVDEPGGDVTFTIDVTNSGTRPVTLESLVDDLYGDLDGVGTCTVPQLVDPGRTYTCSFTQHVEGDADDIVTDTVTVDGSDDRGTAVADEASASVTISDVQPDISLSKDASPTKVRETGGEVTFAIQVLNLGAEAVTVTSLVDDLYGDLTNSGGLIRRTTCVIPQTIQPSESYACTFIVFVSGNPWEDPTDTVTAIANDDEGNETRASDTASVDITQVHQRSIEVVSLTTRLAASRQAISGTFVVENASDELVDVLVTSLDMRVEYRSGKTWVGVTATCAFDPTAPVVFSDDLGIDFSCTLAGPIPASAKTLRTTVLVKIDGRTKTFTFSTTTPI